MAKYLVKRNVLRNGIIYPANASIEMPKDEAAQLIEDGAIVVDDRLLPSTEPPPSQDKKVDPLNPAGLTEDEETITNPLDHLDAEEAIALVEMTTDREELAGYKESEQTGKNRKTVKTAIERQNAKLNT